MQGQKHRTHVPKQRSTSAEIKRIIVEQVAEFQANGCGVGNLELGAGNRYLCAMYLSSYRGFRPSIPEQLYSPPR